MPITQDQKDDILQFLNDKARDDGHPGLTAENFEQYFFGYWDEITDLANADVSGAFKRQRLQDMKDLRDRQDNDRAALDKDIDDLEKELNPRRGRSP